MDIIQLNKEFCIAGQLKFIQGKGGHPFISVNNNSANALISLYGAQVLSYQPVKQEKDLLFLSKKAYYDGKHAIRGGIPVCWPWFGKKTGNIPVSNHGFARNSLWSVADTRCDSEDSVTIKLKLGATDESRAIWPHDSELLLEITIAQKLSLALTTRNTGNFPIILTQALHSYFLVGDINQVLVKGLDKATYRDKLAHDTEKHQVGDISITEETDRIYSRGQDPMVINDPVNNRQILISSTGGQSVIVWNPWLYKSTQTPDLTSSDYQRFICVEIGNAGVAQVNILPGSKHRLFADYMIVPNKFKKE